LKPSGITVKLIAQSRQLLHGVSLWKTLSYKNKAMNETKIDTPIEAENSTGRKLYKAIWRWHFYAGIFAIPFMVMLSITGIIYLFKPQLDAMMYRDLMFVSPRAETSKASDQLESVKAAYPDAIVKAYSPSPAPDRSSKFDITTTDKRNLFVLVDPYDSKFIGSYDADNNLQNYAVLLHGELLIGRVGDTLIELAACWALVLMLTGLYMWLPRNGSGLRGTLLPRLLSKSKRIFWRDIHATTGFYGSLIVIFMIFTGLFWTGFWGETFANVWSTFPPSKNPESVASVRTGSLNTTADKKVAWAVEQMPMPESDPHADHKKADVSSYKSTQDGVNLDVVDKIARDQNVLAGYSIVFPRKETGVYTITAPLGDPYRQQTIHVDQYSGKILANVGWQDYGTVPKAVTVGIALHEGLAFGPLNQLLMLFAALAVLVLSVSGTVMWWKRRPVGTLGAPSMPENFRLLKTGVVLIIILGILFPLVGLSLVLVLLFDRFILRRLPRAKKVFG
jgi:uncharacterized iron-regulated membrane protein